MGIALKAENISIRYITGDFKDIGLKEYTVRKLTGNYCVKEFMAVDGVSFELESGDMLGIIGSNGAGKSTLLKAIAGIMEPTQGKITSQGEIAALLELGSGFDGDLTVKENAYLRGAMLGYTQEFMDETYEQIVEFAELRGFEDRPFKQLSSGMKSRLAFSIASLVSPDILILDEVLSVGDGAFQEKSARKMREIISRGATTILVSHSLEQIRSLCNKILWLDHGKQIAFGETQEICDQYERFLQGECPATMSDDTVTDPTNELAEVECTKEIAPELARKLRNKGRALIAGLVLAIFTGLVSHTAIINFQKNHPIMQSIYITADDPANGAVTYRGAYVDDIWQSPWDTVVDDRTWSVNSAEDTRTATDSELLEVRLPRGSRCKLIFTAGPNGGNVTIEVGNKIAHLELYNGEEVPLGLDYDISTIFVDAPSEKHLIPNIIAAILALTVFCIAFISVLCNERNYTPGERDVWGDSLRGICCFVIVLLHNTCNIYNDFSMRLAAWIPHLLMNSFTAFVVPCFYMISGAYLLRREHSVRQTLTKRVPKLLIPLLFWSICYILLSGKIEAKQIILMFFQEQTPHLWFMYRMLAIYFLLPLLSKLYCSLNMKMKLYLLTLFLVVPTLLYDTEHLIDRYVTMPRFAIFWPDLGLFFLGAVLWDLRDHTEGKYKQFVMPFLLGLACTTCTSLFATLRVGSPDKVFFSMGCIGNILMAASILCFFLALRKSLQKVPKWISSLIAIIGQNSFGVYLVHMMFLMCLNRAVFPQIPIYNNEDSLIKMIFSASVYFTLSVLVCWSGRQTRLFKRLF